MPLGFKIADGYVEVHADYDKGELRRAAQAAADDHDEAFNKERTRNARDSSTRDTNRKIGGLASADFVKGMQEQIDRDKDKPIISVDRVKRDASMLARVHVTEFEKEVVVKQSTRWQRIGRRISGRISQGVGRDARLSGSAFLRGFIEAVTFGQADIGRGVASAMKPAMATAGTIVGGIFAGFLIAEIGAALTAVTPILLGGLIAAIPFISLIKSGVKKEDGKWRFQANEMGRALKKLSGEWKEFRNAISAPFKSSLIQILDAAGNSLRRLTGPWTALVKAVSPGIVALFKGVFGAIEGFITAIGPAMPGVVAGLKEWGIQLPIIGKALGDMFAKWMSDPEKVKAAVQNISIVIRDLLKVLGILVPILTTAGNALVKWGNAFKVGKMLAQAFINWVRAVFPALKAFFVAVWNSIRSALTSAWNAIKSTAISVWTAIKGVFVTAWNAIKSAVRSAVNTVKSVIRSGITNMKAVWDSFWKSKFGQVVKNALGLVKDLVKLNMTIIKTLIRAGMAVVKAVWTTVWNAVKTVARAAWNNIKSVVTTAVNAVKSVITRVLNQVRSFVSSHTAGVRSRVSAAWNAIKSATRAAWNAVRSATVSAWNAVVSAIRSKVNAAMSVVRSIKGKVTGALAGAGRWLYNAGSRIIGGLLDGINSKISAVRSALANLTSLIPSWKGPADRDKKLLVGPGKRIMGSLITGFKQGEGEVKSYLGGLTGAMPAMAGGAGSSRSYSSTFSPTVNVHVTAGLNGIDPAVKRALTKEIFLSLEDYKKDYQR